MIPLRGLGPNLLNKLLFYKVRKIFIFISYLFFFEKLIFKAERCLGCGVCVYKCPKEAIVMKRRDEDANIPKNLMELGMRFAKEKGIDMETIDKMFDA